MKPAFVFADMTTGLGDMYNLIYRLYILQKALNSRGFEMHVYIDAHTSPYKKIKTPDDFNFFKKIFNFDIFNKYTFITYRPTVKASILTNYTEAYKHHNIYNVYISADEHLDNFEPYAPYEKDLNFWYRDYLSDIHFLNKDLYDYCDQQSKLFLPETFYCLHHRSIEDKHPTVDTALNKFIEECTLPIVLICNTKYAYDSLTKEYSKLIPTLNNFTLANIETYHYISKYIHNDEELFEYLKTTAILDMYVVSKAKKIICTGNLGRISNFVFFGIQHNQTDIKNSERVETI